MPNCFLSLPEHSRSRILPLKRADFLSLLKHSRLQEPPFKLANFLSLSGDSGPRDVSFKLFRLGPPTEPSIVVRVKAPAADFIPSTLVRLRAAAAKPMPLLLRACLKLLTTLLTMKTLQMMWMTSGSRAKTVRSTQGHVVATK